MKDFQLNGSLHFLSFFYFFLFRHKDVCSEACSKVQKLNWLNHLSNRKVCIFWVYSYFFVTIAS